MGKFIDGRKMQRNRPCKTWVCEKCGMKIHGKRNTIHLGVLAHSRKHDREENNQN